MIRNRESPHLHSTTLGDLSQLRAVFQIPQPAHATWRVYDGINSRYMTDEVTPDFKRRRNSGELIMNPLTSYRVNMTRVGSLSVTGSNVGSFPFNLQTDINPFAVNDVYGSGSWKGNTCPINLEATKSFCSEVIQGCYSYQKLADCTSMASQRAFGQRGRNFTLIGEDFAEMGQTISLFPHLIQDAILLLQSYRRTSGLSDLANASKDDWLRQFKRASSAWLACRYGIRPLVYTLRNYIVGLSERYTSMRMTSRGYMVDKAICSYPHWFITNDGSWRMQYTTDLSVVVSAKATVIDQIDLDLANLLALRTGADRIIQTAWELVPYSFVVDWFIDVSSWLQAWTPKWQSTLGAACVTTRVVHTMQTYGFSVTPSSYVYRSLYGVITDGQMTCTNPSCIVKVNATTRTPGGYLPYLPTFRVRLDTLKVVDLLSMLGQLLPGWLRQLRRL